VVTVGRQQLSEEEFEQRLQKVPFLQKQRWTESKQTLAEGFLHNVIIPEFLFQQAAESKGLLKRSDVRRHIQEIYRAQLLNVMQQEMQTERVLDDSVLAYWQEHKSAFESQERLLLWRILANTREEAQQVIQATRQASNREKAWKETARSLSQDKATSERGGNLGAIGPDGQSDEVTVRVNQELYQAALSGTDGEILPEPVLENGRYAVIWKRATLRVAAQPLAQAAPGIRSLLLRQQMGKNVKNVLASLREKLVRNVSYEPLEGLDLRALLPSLITSVKPPQAAVPQHQGLASPQPSARGLR